VGRGRGRGRGGHGVLRMLRSEGSAEAVGEGVGKLGQRLSEVAGG